jgi:hypothetical protein
MTLIFSYKRTNNQNDLGGKEQRMDKPDTDEIRMRYKETTK